MKLALIKSVQTSSALYPDHEFTGHKGMDGRAFCAIVLLIGMAAQEMERIG